MRAPAEQRYNIIYTWNQLQSLTAVSEHLACSLSLVKRWVGRYKATKSLVDRARRGRKRAINDSNLEEVYNLLMSNDYGGAEGVARRLAVLGITSKVHHRTTITRAAKEVAKRKGVNIQAVRGKPKKLLPAITLKKRLTLAQLRTGWSNVMFTDSKKFHFTYPGPR